MARAQQYIDDQMSSGHGIPVDQSHEYPDPELSQLQSSTFREDALNEARAEFTAQSTEQRRHKRRKSGDESDILNLDLGFESDSDPDYREFDKGILKMQRDVRLARNMDSDDESLADDSQVNTRTNAKSIRGSRGAHGGRVARRGGIRGPRKAAEPTGDIKLRLSQANQAFLNGRYEEARDIASEIIRINAETYEAWNLLASTFKELQDPNKALMALMVAATMRPKHPGPWFNCAYFALNETGGHRSEYLISAQYSCSQIIKANSMNLEARRLKASIMVERGNLGLAIAEYKFILRHTPLDTKIIQKLAAIYVDQGDVELAKKLYNTAIVKLKDAESSIQETFGWTDAYAYIELYGILQQYKNGIQALKSVARWLLGRDAEQYWNNIMADDSEWDEDDSRRAECIDFTAGKYPKDSYGLGLPIEFRVKLGLYRMALGHYEEALVSDDTGRGLAEDYPHLFEEVADSLSHNKLWSDALRFYRPLLGNAGPSGASLQLKVGKCWLGEGDNKEAEICFQAAVQLDEDNIPARMELARLYERLNEKEQAFIYVNEIMALRRDRQDVLDELSNITPPSITTTKAVSNSKHTLPTIARKPQSRYRPHKLADPSERRKEEAARAEQLQSQLSVMRSKLKPMREGEVEATNIWMEAARDLIDDFRGFKTFYPWDKYVKFLGYTRGDRMQAETVLETDLTEMADRLSKNLGADADSKTTSRAAGIPADYRGIPFGTWLDIFLEYAICLAKEGKAKEAYEICEAAKDAIVFYHSREDMFLIHICWGTCALLCNDEEMCVTVARYFMREYQFTTDSYRMYAAIARLCQSPVSWYCSGPTQKYMLRQVKAMDFSLVDANRRQKNFSEKAAYSTQDKDGRILINDDMDIALLMLYGHILYSGASYIYALNYFLRAYALDPDNPVINMNIGLCYVHHALKRQADNRQFLILQGMAFLFDYYDTRKKSSVLEERQEAHYNIARVYHMLGISHLAITYYLRVLDELKDHHSSREDLVIDTAHNLKIICMITGNKKLAHSITKRWLVI
ncbi:hypothetical protein CJF30_00003016 [Rutstroemia sp. NJR-2017a BBW]|nr:hypothetical protein CJF30_00003016 [Rutstroemia sp. NJR-2017a BBW]